MSCSCWGMIPGLCRSVLSIIVEKDNMNAASALANGFPGPNTLNSLPAKASIKRSMHCASPGRRKCPKNIRRALSKVECVPEKSNALTYSSRTYRR